MQNRRKTKVTLLVDHAVAEELRNAVAEGRAASQSALVQDAVVDYLSRKEQEALRQAYTDAAGDPAFLADLEQVAHDFKFADDDLERGSAR